MLCPTLSDMSKEREPRTERIDVRVTAADKDALERAAAKYDMTTSEYVRACAVFVLLIGADPHGLRMLGRGISDAVKERFRKLMASAIS